MSNKKMIPAVVAAAAMAFGFGQAVQAKSPVPGKPGKQNIVEGSEDLSQRAAEAIEAARRIEWREKRKKGWV